MELGEEHQLKIWQRGNSGNKEGRKTFDKLTAGFENAIGIKQGYPGIANPQIIFQLIKFNRWSLTISQQLNTSDSDGSLELPENYNGLGVSKTLFLVF